MLLAIGTGATAFGKPSQFYSIITGMLATFGAVTLLEARRLQADVRTRLDGLRERISISVFLLWVGGLAARLLRTMSRSRTAMDHLKTTWPM
jgi:hypothetical protein